MAITRNCRRQPQRMSNRTRGKAMKDAVTGIVRGPRRSPLFHWMVENHADLARAASSNSLSWSHLCATVQALGLTDVRGKPPSPATARKTWYRARVTVRRLAASAVKSSVAAPTLHPPMRSATPPGPLAAIPVRAAPGQMTTRFHPPPADTTAETEAEAEARTEANLARLDHHFDVSAGRIPEGT